MLFSLKALPLAVFATTIHHLSSTVHAVKTLSELFDVSFDATVGGNCAAIGSARMQAMLDDAHDLALAGIAMVTAANDQNNPLYAEAVRNLDAWFESPFLSAVQYDRVGDVYTAVDDWIEGRITNVDGGKSSLKPLLICGDNSFVLRQSMSDQAWGFDQNHNQVRLTHNNNSPFHIRENQEYVNNQAAASLVLGQQAYPYWVSRLGLYIFDKMYGQTQQPTDYICAGEARPNTIIPHGVTKGWPAPKPNLVILCPTAFRNAGRRTHSVAVNCLDATQLVNTRPPAGVTGITNVIAIIPDGATLFHEMIHLILGVDATKPTTGEEYTPSKLLGKVARDSGQVMTSTEAFANPETYMYAANGFDYSQSAPLFNGHVVEFYTGWCTFQT